MIPLDKKRLEDYRLLEQQIQALEQQIKELENRAAQYEHATVKGSNPEFPYQPVTFHSQGYNIRYDERRRERVRKLKDKLMRQKADAEYRRIEVQEWIAEIPDTTVRLIFTYKYVDGLTHRQIGRRLHMEQSNVGKKINAYLKMEPNSPKYLI